MLPILNYITGHDAPAVLRQTSELEKWENIPDDWLRSVVQRNRSWNVGFSQCAQHTNLLGILVCPKLTAVLRFVKKVLNQASSAVIFPGRSCSMKTEQTHRERNDWYAI